MPRKQKVPLKALQDPLQYPIRKSKTFSRNLCSFIRMLDKHFSSLPSKNYLRLVHKYVLKCRTRFKKEHQTGYISVRQQIKICKACDGWTGRRPMVHCLQC